MANVHPPTAPAPGSVLGTDGTDFYVLRTDATGHLQIDVVTVADLRGALQSVSTDRLRVRGEDQLWSIKTTYFETKALVSTGAGSQVLNSTPTPAGVYRVYTRVHGYNLNSATATLRVFRNTTNLENQIDAGLNLVAGQPHVFNCWMPLKVGEFIYVILVGTTVGDNLGCSFTGFDITVES